MLCPAAKFIPRRETSAGVATPSPSVDLFAQAKRLSVRLAIHISPFLGPKVCPESLSIGSS